MSRLGSKEATGTLREFIKENESIVFYFCRLMLTDKEETEWVVLETFREFGEFYRRHLRVSKSDLKIKLFSIAWQLITDAQEDDKLRWLNGRDTRKLSDWELNLLQLWNKSHEINSTMETGLINRIQLLSLEFKAPLILKDILHFEDEEILQILGNRWGVYRHRLHRGRLDLLEGLKGSAASREAGPEVSQ